MRPLLSVYLLFVLLSFEACAEHNRNLTSFKNTEAYELAQAVSNDDLVKVGQHTDLMCWYYACISKNLLLLKSY